MIAASAEHSNQTIESLFPFNGWQGFPGTVCAKHAVNADKLGPRNLAEERKRDLECPATDLDFADQLKPSRMSGELDDEVTVAARRRAMKGMELGGIWSAAFSDMLELGPDRPSNFVARDQTLARLDQIFIRALAHLAPAFAPRAAHAKCAAAKIDRCKCPRGPRVPAVAAYAFASERWVRARDIGGGLVGAQRAFSPISGACYAAELLDGLALRLQQCCLAPVPDDVSSRLRKQVADALAKLAPRWRGLLVESNEVYLGVRADPEDPIELHLGKKLGLTRAMSDPDKLLTVQDVGKAVAKAIGGHASAPRSRLTQRIRQHLAPSWDSIRVLRNHAVPGPLRLLWGDGDPDFVLWQNNSHRQRRVVVVDVEGQPGDLAIPGRGVETSASEPNSAVATLEARAPKGGRRPMPPPGGPVGGRLRHRAAPEDGPARAPGGAAQPARQPLRPGAQALALLALAAVASAGGCLVLASAAASQLPEDGGALPRPRPPGLRSEAAAPAPPAPPPPVAPCAAPPDAALAERVAAKAGEACVARLRDWGCELAAVGERVAARAAGEAAAPGLGGAGGVAAAAAAPQRAPARLAQRARALRDARRGSAVAAPEPPRACLAALGGEWPAGVEHVPVPDQAVSLGVVLLVHRWWRNAVRLLSRLLAARATLGAGLLTLRVVVHVDPRASEAREALQRWAAGRPGIEIFQAFNITRGGEAMLLATLEGMRRLSGGLATDAPDWTLLLSESHYLLRSPGQLYAHLLLLRGLSFVGIHYWLRDGGSLGPFLGARSRAELPKLPWEREEKSRKLVFECNAHVFVELGSEPNATIPEPLLSEPYVGGPQWVALSRQLLQASLPGGGTPASVADRALEQVRLFAQPDESFFQTLLALVGPPGAADPCGPLALQNIGYSLTWNEPAQFLGPDPSSEVEVTSPSLLNHLNEEPDLEAALAQAWSTPSLFARKLDDDATRPLQDRLDDALDNASSWEEAPELAHLCALLLPGAALGTGTAEPGAACSPRRLVPGAPAAAELLPPRLVARLAPAAFAVERWAPRPAAVGGGGPPRAGLRILALRVGRARPPTAEQTLSGSRELLQASVVGPGEGELGLLALFEALPLSLDLLVEWAGPDNESLKGSAAAGRHARSLWASFPSRSPPAAGEWRVALRLPAEAPAGPRPLAWRRFTVLPVAPGLAAPGAGAADLGGFFDVAAAAPPV
ncbi:unnamed protein product [Prorocentrum cordatum]|uniref:Protein xylosyltransferase n=1 Tax=Prorocentrum cordatum TaxID=2364126 RepID=A0ABN9PP51_9DINO|nr:unnamed protein product [Polarella glacialis]